MNKAQLRLKCERIAREAGAKLTWLEDGDYGYYIPGTNKIFVGGKSKQAMIIIFCHELGHYKNFLSGKYYNYHHLTGKKLFSKFKTKAAIVRYSLKAEIYTDKVGRRLCAKHFPEIVYKGTYKMNKAYYDAMYAKYFGGFIVILVDDTTYFVPSYKILLDFFNFV